jgi:hypothetical protein
MPIYTEIYDSRTRKMADVVMAKDGKNVYWIPKDEGNKDWQEYQQWLASGNKPIAAEVPDENSH